MGEGEKGDLLVLEALGTHSQLEALARARQLRFL